MDGALTRDHRLRLHLSQARFAELCGVPQAALSSFELGKSRLRLDQLKAIEEGFANTALLEELVRRPKRYQKPAAMSKSHLKRQYVIERSSANANYIQVLHELSLALGKPTQGPAALTLFSGCGGMSLGLKASGFRIVGFLEKDDDLRAIYRANFPDTDSVAEDILRLPSAGVEDWVRRVGTIDLVAGGPPCQGFSLAGKRSVEDQRNDLFREYLRVVAIVRPKFALLENVRLLTSMKTSDGSYVKDEILAGFQQIGYLAKSFEINVKDYGVPQHRERVIFVAVRKDLATEPSFPEPTHGTASGLFHSVVPPLTFADACSDLEYLESGGSSLDPLHKAVTHPEHVVRWLWDVPQGMSAHENANPEDRPPSGYNTTYKRQVWNEPGATVQTTFGMISGCRNVHPIATRSLTIREAARLQSFPDSFRFEGTLGTIRTGIGNAVPPLLARVVGRHLLQLLL